MNILTEAFKDRAYFIRLGRGKDEGLYAKPVSLTERRRIALDAMRESGGDLVLAGHIETERLLQASLTGWVGLWDSGGKEIPFSQENISMICEHDPDAAADFSVRVKNIARLGELDDEKN